jgi:hypothetical protein
MRGCLKRVIQTIYLWLMCSFMSASMVDAADTSAGSSTPNIPTACGTLGYPLDSGNYTSPYGCSASRNPSIPGASHCHKGVDFAATFGTPVKASCGGTIGFVDASCSWGTEKWNAVKAAGGSISPSGGCTISILCNDSSAGTLVAYGHLSSVGVSVGQSVNKGQQVAATGNTGAVDAYHLHFLTCKSSQSGNPWVICPDPTNTPSNDPTSQLDCNDPREQYGQGMQAARDMGMQCVSKGGDPAACRSWYKNALQCLSNRAASPAQCLAGSPPTGGGQGNGSGVAAGGAAVNPVTPCVTDPVDENDVNEAGSITCGKTK